LRVSKHYTSAGVKIMPLTKEKGNVPKKGRKCPERKETLFT